MQKGLEWGRFFNLNVGGAMKRYLFWSVLAVNLVVHSQQTLAGDYTWTLIKDQEGIQLYVSDSPDTPFKTFKAETVINQPFEAVLEVMLDIPSYPQWMTGSRSANIVKLLSPERTDGNMILHMTWDAIWPFNNRDIVMKVKTINDWENDRVIVWLNNTNEADVPLEPGLVRIAYFSAQYQFTYMDRDHTRVVYMNTIDPSGVVTPSLAMVQTANVPFNTLKGLAKQASNPIYIKLAKEDFY